MMTKESEKSLKAAGRNVETTKTTTTTTTGTTRGTAKSGGGDSAGGGTNIRLRPNSGQTTPNNKKQRSNMAPSSDTTTTTSNTPSQNGHSEDQVNGIRPNRPCCLCWCCCCSCSCLDFRNNQDNKPTKHKDPDSVQDCDEAPPTLEEVRSWGESFEKLMRSSAGQKVFREFLKCEYSEENILFWLACEDLKKQSKPEVIEEKARIIYEDYISILSPKEVSLDSRVREVVNQNMVDPTPHTFDEAQVQIFTLMHRDSYPRFVNSPLYKKLAQLNNTSQHRGSSVSAISNPASRKQSIAS